MKFSIPVLIMSFCMSTFSFAGEPAVPAGVPGNMPARPEVVVPPPIPNHGVYDGWGDEGVPVYTSLKNQTLTGLVDGSDSETTQCRLNKGTVLNFLNYEVKTYTLSPGKYEALKDHENERSVEENGQTVFKKVLVKAGEVMTQYSSDGEGWCLAEIQGIQDYWLCPYNFGDDTIKTLQPFFEETFVRAQCNDGNYAWLARNQLSDPKAFKEDSEF